MTLSHTRPTTPPAATDAPPARSKVEVTKESSVGLRGGIAEQLSKETDQFAGSDPQLLKFHGIYQQEDRDARKAARGGAGARQHMMMARSKVPGGLMTAEQYLVQDELCTRYGNGTLRITTRQDFQFHGVLKRNLKRTIRELNDALVTTFGGCGDVVRNVMCCPVPIDDVVRTAILAEARVLSDRLLPATRSYFEIWLDGEQVAAGEPEDEPLYGRTYLPRKFKIALAYPGDNCVDIYSNDVGIVAVVEDGQLAGFNVLAGGGLGMTHGMEATYPRLADPICFVPAGDLAPVVEAIVAVHRDHGDRKDRKRARLKYVVAAWGVARFRAELEGRLGRALAAPRPMEWNDAADHLGWGEQGDGRLYLGLWVENGRIADTPDSQLRSGLRAVIDQVRPGVRLTPQQNVILAGIAPSDRPLVEKTLWAHGVRLPDDIATVRRHSMACPAMPTCGLALAEAERALPAVLDEIETVLAELGLAEERLSIRMTGCPNGCARPYLGDVGIVGRTLDKYNIYLGGDFNGTRLNTEFAELVSTADLAPTLRPLFATFRDERLPGEGFGDFCHRLGAEGLRRTTGQAVPVGD